MSRPEVAAALAVTAGLGAFLVLADPSGGVDDPGAARWIVSLRRGGGAVRRPDPGRARPPPVHRAALLGTAAGILFALSAALTKATVEQLDDGVLAIFEHWQLYALSWSAT